MNRSDLARVKAVFRVDRFWRRPRDRRPLGLWKWLVVAALFCPVELSGQLTTDQVPRERTIATQQQVRDVLEKSRFRLGPFHLIPELRVSNAGYTDNAFGVSDQLPKLEDYYGTVSGGARWAVPVGGKFYVEGEVRPSYDWSKNVSAWRTFGGLYSASLLGFFNRLSFDVSGYNTRGVEFLNSETEFQEIHTVRDGSAKVEVELLRKVSVYLGAEAQRHRYGLEALVPTVNPNQRIDVSVLNRTEAVGRAGVRLRFATSFDVTAGVEGNQTEFTTSTVQGDNQGVAYLAGLHYDRPRFFVNLSGGYREQRPRNSSAYPRFSSWTGSYFTSYFLTRRVELQAYGGRRPVYGLFASNPYYIETRNGGNVNLGVFTRVALRAFVEYGTNDSPRAVAVSAANIQKKDRVTTYGGGFTATVFRTMALSAVASHSDYRSNVPGFSHSVLRVTGDLTILGQ